MPKSIRIENPVSDCQFTSKKRATRFVAQGRAQWAKPGVSIRFIQSDHRHCAARKSVDVTRYWYERAEKRPGRLHLIEKIYLALCR